VGQRCFAVGTPLGLKRTFTGGLLSNVDRSDLGTETKVFQTDAAINPGNSGGPLFDQEGRVLGINTYASQGNNLGFTIPIHVAAVLRDHFLAHGRFVRAVLPYYLSGELYDELAQALGVDGGLLMPHVLPDSPAAAAGLRDGDVIVEIDGRPCAARTVAEALDLDWALMTRPVGSQVSFTLITPATKARRTIRFTLQAMEPMPRQGRHAGEMVETRYDAIGLGVRDIALLQRLTQNLAPVKGVIVTTATKTDATGQADVQVDDVITAVGGQATPDLASFRRALESALASRSKYVELSLARRNLRLETALAPHYLLRGCKVSLVVPPREPEYVELMHRELLAAGAAVRLFSVDGQPVPAPSGPIEVQGALSDLVLEQTDLLLFAGGAGGRDLWDRADVRKLVDAAAQSDKTIAAVGPAALLLAGTAEPLKGRKLTITKEDSAAAIQRGATYTGSEIETDGHLVTTTGFDRASVRRFVKKLVRLERDRL
jgi:S1-C subfamily serine protease/putative intracellular protease/amidase